MDSIPHLPASWAQPSPGVLARQGSEPRKRQGLKRGEPTRQASGRGEGSCREGGQAPESRGRRERREGGVSRVRKEVARASGVGTGVGQGRRGFLAPNWQALTGVGASGFQSREGWLSILHGLCGLDWGARWVRGPFQPAHTREGGGHPS